MDEKTLYVRVRGKVLGPFNPQQLRALRDRGHFRRFHEISEDRQSWASAASLELFSTAEAGGTGQRDGHGTASPPSATEWHYVDAQGKQQGPVTREHLVTLWQSGAVNSSTLLWKEGMGNWEPILPTITGLSQPEDLQAGLLFGFCPDCGKKVSIRAANCPHCGCPVGREGGGRPAAVSSWSTVSTGLNLIQIAFAVVAISLIVMAIGAGIIAAMALNETVAGVVLIVLGAVGFVVALVLVLIGEGMCCGAPDESQAKGWAIGAIVCHIIAVLFSFLGGWVNAAVLGILGTPLNWVAGILFLLFLRQVAVHFKNEPLARSVIYYLVYSICYPIAIIAFAVIAVLIDLVVIEARVPALARETTNASIALGVLFLVLTLVGAIISLVWFLVLLSRTRQTIRKGAGHRPA